MNSPKEIKIPVPWGHIAGKSWGHTNHQKVFFVHGKQDNCGAFDRLIPLLQNNYYIVAIDLPGHGFSSHFPPGVPIQFTNYIIAIKKVLDHLRWEQFYYVGHSLGGQFGLFIAALFPQAIQKLIVIDHIGPAFVPESEIVSYLGSVLRDFLRLEKRLETGKPPVYTYEETLDKLTERESALTSEAAKIILKRSLVKHGTGYTFVMDQRIKLDPFPTNNSTLLKQVVTQIDCPILFILATQRLEAYKAFYADVIKALEAKPNFTSTIVDGCHDVHQNDPEKIAPLIDKFLLTSCKL